LKIGSPKQLKGLPVTKENIEEILNEILSIDLGDNVTFNIKNINSIHDISEYEDFRVSLEAKFFTIKVNMKIDITTGDIIIPREVDYSFKLMFEERSIPIKAYNLNTILAEKIETILARNISNTRARDYYDVYMLTSFRKDDINIVDLRSAIIEKAKERNTLIYLDEKEKYIADIEESKDLQFIWDSYTKKYPYAQGIKFDDIIKKLKEILGEEK
jgi:predicted nucleotidyltransferase component of viral defense system